MNTLFKRLSINLRVLTSIRLLPTYSLNRLPVANFSKKKESGGGNDKKAKVEKEKSQINKEYENVSTTELKDRYKQQSDNIFNKFKEELSTIRLSRSNPKILDNVQVTIKGKKYNLVDLSTIMVRGANILVINPYEEEHKEPIIKAVESSKLDVQITVEDTNIVVTLGAIPSDMKNENVQMAKKFSDSAKEKLKALRHNCNAEFKKLEKIIGKDEGRKLEAQILDAIDK